MRRHKADISGDANPQQDMINLIRNNMPIEQKANVSDGELALG